MPKHASTRRSIGLLRPSRVVLPALLCAAAGLAASPLNAQMRAAAAPAPAPAAGTLPTPQLANGLAADVQAYFNSAGASLHPLEGVFKSLGQIKADVNDPAARAALTPVRRALESAVPKVLDAARRLDSCRPSEQPRQSAASQAEPARLEDRRAVAEMLSVLAHPALLSFLPEQSRQEVVEAAREFRAGLSEAKRARIDASLAAMAGALTAGDQPGDGAVPASSRWMALRGASDAPPKEWRLRPSPEAEQAGTSGSRMSRLRRETPRWDESIRHSNDFYIAHGWDPASGSFSSEISDDGKVLSRTRHLIASSRMAYGLAHGSEVEPKYLPYARAEAEFLLGKMVQQDPQGAYFKSAVDQTGSPVSKQDRLVANEQAYGLNGLVALYAVTKDPALLKTIQGLYQSFYRRFHDPVRLGFFDGYDLGSGRPIATKSYNSTVYVATSFLLELAELRTPRRREYVRTIQELADIVAGRFLDPKTGWIIENFSSDWKEDWRDWQKQSVDGPQGKREVTIGVTGHNFQAAWFLMRAAELPGIPRASKDRYLAAARDILSSMLGSRAVDREKGGVFDVFKREDGESMWHTNKAWWQQAEAILALTKADILGLLPDPARRADARRVRDQIVEFYFAHFIDHDNGGEFPVVQRDGTPIRTENKGQLGTGTYHQVELARFMTRYASEGGASVPAPADPD